MSCALVAALLLAAVPAAAAPDGGRPASEITSMRLESSPFGGSAPELALYEPSPVISKLALASSGITAPREPKKPKQPKPLPAPPRSAFTAPPGKAGPSGKKP